MGQNVGCFSYNEINCESKPSTYLIMNIRIVTYKVSFYTIRIFIGKIPKNEGML